MFLAYLLLLICSFLISAFDLVSSRLSLPLFIVANLGLMWELAMFLKNRLFYRRLREHYRMYWLKHGNQSNNFSNGMHTADLGFAEDVVIVSSDSEYYELPLSEIRSIMIFNAQQLLDLDIEDMAEKLGVSSGEQVYAHIYNLLLKHRSHRKDTFILLSLERVKQPKYRFGPVINPLIFFFDCSKHEIQDFLQIKCIQSRLHNYLKLLK